MFPDHNIPAEVRAARKASAEKGPWEHETAQPVSAITALTPLTPAVDELLEEILGGDSVDIIGLFPWQCASRLITLKDERRRDGRSSIQPDAVRYLMPGRNSVLIYRHSGEMGPVVQRWIAGVNGFRHWLRDDTDGNDTSASLTLLEFDALYLECAIHVHRNDGCSVTMLSQLPSVAAGRSGDGPEEAPLVITRMAKSQVSDFHRYLAKLQTRTRPALARQILCHRPPAGEPAPKSGSEFRPVILQLHPRLSSGPPNSVSAATIVAVCAATRHGEVVVLKNRTTQNSYTDIGTLALISERVADTDLPLPEHRIEGSDPDRILDSYWISLGKPADLQVPETAFKAAAQRELLLSCGLDVPPERLDLRGTCLVSRDDDGRYLGFYVYRLDLVRAPGSDELDHALAWNAGLEPVLVKDLYRADGHIRLGRLLRQRESWLREFVFGESGGATA